MNAQMVQCGKCRSPVPSDLFNLPDLQPCPSCNTLLSVEVFPAFYRSLPSGTDAEMVITEEEAGCFYHPEKKAVVPCEACGRFLCALCDCELQGRHLCPACLETGRKKGRLKSLENGRMLWDGIALSLAIFPMLIFYFTIFTAPTAIYLSIRHWNTPTSIVGRGKGRFVAAIVLASLQIIGWVALALVLILN